MTIGALMVPLTAFDSWQAVCLYGDIKQLEPIIIGADCSEVADFSKIPITEWRDLKGFSYVFLDEQHRMAPSIASFPSRTFYDNRLKTAQSVRDQYDHPIRQAMRSYCNDLTERAYAKEGKQRDIPLPNSEYFMVTVDKGKSRVEDNGTSLQKYASANAITKIIEELLQKGDAEKSIIIVSLYKAQRTVITQEIEVMLNGGWSFGEWATVDSYQGQQGDVVILDMVIANPFIDAQEDQYGIKRDASG